MFINNDEGDCLRMQGREWAAQGIDMVESRIPKPGEVKYGLLNDHIHPFIYCLCALFFGGDVVGLAGLASNPQSFF